MTKGPSKTFGVEVIVFENGKIDTHLMKNPRNRRYQWTLENLPIERQNSSTKMGLL
jgi:hypothetical protein